MSDLIATYGLTPLQNALVCEYLGNGFNKKKASDKIGCSASMFADPKVQNAINDRSREIVAESNFKAVALVNHLSDIALANVADYVEWNGRSARVKDDLPPEVMACVKKLHTDKDGVTTVELHDKYGAIDRLSKLLGWYKEESNVTVVAQGDVTVVERSKDELNKELAFEMRKFLENNNQITDVEVIEDGDDSSGL